MENNDKRSAEKRAEREAERNEKIFDAILKIALEEAVQEEMDALPSNEELNKLYPRSEALDKKVYAAIRREYRPVRIKRAVHKLARVAAVFLLFAAFGAGVLFADFRGEATESGMGTGIVFGYIPQGFEPVGTAEYHTFADDTGQQFTVHRIAGDIFENENAETAEHASRREGGLLYREENTLRRDFDENVIIVTSYINHETLARILENIEMR